MLIDQLLYHFIVNKYHQSLTCGLGETPTLWSLYVQNGNGD